MNDLSWIYRRDNMKAMLKGFMDFVREQGVVGLGVGLVLGGAVTKLVGSLVNDIITPLLGLAMGSAGNLKEEYLQIGASKLMWGSFVSTMIDFVIVALVVYLVVNKLGLDKVDKKK